MKLTVLFRGLHLRTYIFIYLSVYHELSILIQIANELDEWMFSKYEHGRIFNVILFLNV